MIEVQALRAQVKELKAELEFKESQVEQYKNSTGNTITQLMEARKTIEELRAENRRLQAIVDAMANDSLTMMTAGIW